MIGPFRDEYRFLSNFWFNTVYLDNWPTATRDDNLPYKTNEHAYVASKSISYNERLKIWELTSPGQAKTKQKTIITLRPDWEEIKLKVMEDLVRQKFTNNPDLRMRLLMTGDEELVELNTWNDTFWGVCQGKGQNHLGKLLMLVRSELADTD